MTAHITSIRIVGHSGDAAVIASNAARRDFPSALVTRTDELAEIGVQEFAPGAELLVLLTSSAPDLTRVASTLDARGWPRWAIVALSAADAPADSHVVTIAPEDWTEPVLMLGLRAAVQLQALKSTGAQLAGDIRTITRRMGHDMRSPLNSILTTSEAMLDPDEDPASPRAVFAQSIAGAVSEVMQLFERMSFILRATTNPPPRQTVIMEEIVWGALQRLESRMLHAGITVEKPAKWPIIEGVPVWLDAIWSNLLNNCLEHAGPNRKIKLGWEQLPRDYRFWVSNQGSPLSAQQEGLLFYPFDRMSELHAPRGLGLPTIRRLVELQGGRYGYDREAGGHWSFYFTLPVEPDVARPSGP